MHRGYVKLYRKTTDSRIFQNEGLLKFWVWCLLKANHEEAWVSFKMGTGVTEVHLLPGQFIFGRKSAAKELNMSPSTVRNRMEKLKKIQKLDIRKDTHCSIITIINWGSYQGGNKKEDKRKDRQGTPRGQAEDTNKNYKNEKNTPICDFFELKNRYPDQDLLQQVFDAIASTRKFGKVSDSILIKELQYWSKYPVDVVEQSLQKYLMRNCAEQGKNEKYLRGIIRNEKKAEEINDDRFNYDTEQEYF